MNLQKYFQDQIVKQEPIHGHFNKNFKIQTTQGTYHLKIFHDKSYIINSWINGEVIREWGARSIRLVCQELMVLHATSVNWKVMDYQVKKINDMKYRQLLGQYQNDPWVACHNDLNKDNIIISNQRAIFIDFEFKRTNHCYWDIANIINEDNLGEHHIDLFLKYYNGLCKKKLKDFLYINKVFNDYWKKQT